MSNFKIIFRDDPLLLGIHNFSTKYTDGIIPTPFCTCGLYTGTKQNLWLNCLVYNRSIFGVRINPLCHSSNFIGISPSFPTSYLTTLLTTLFICGKKVEL